jgi:WD40 repeat protein
MFVVSAGHGSDVTYVDWQPNSSLLASCGDDDSTVGPLMLCLACLQDTEVICTGTQSTTLTGTPAS